MGLEERPHRNRAAEGDAVKSMNDNEVKGLFVRNLKMVFPDLKNEEILHSAIFRETCVQPLQALGSGLPAPGFSTPLPNVYAVNSSMIVNSTLNNNAAISLAREAAAAIINAGTPPETCARIAQTRAEFAKA